MKLQEEIDIFAGRIKLAIKAAQQMGELSLQLRHRCQIVQQASRDAQSFGFVAEELKRECRLLSDCMDDAQRLLNSLEAGARGLRSVAVMEKVWREMP